jgi:hypothetical protein
MTKGQAVITEKFGPHNCNVGEDGGFAPNVSRQVCLHSKIITSRDVVML